MSRAIAVSLLLTLAAGACGGDDPPEDEAPASLSDAIEQATAAISSRTGDVEPVSAEKLQDLLPDDVDGLDRVDVSRSETAAMGIRMSTTTARYEKDDGRSVTIVITDLGGLGAVGTMAAAAWAMTDFERTTQDGYERTARFEGFKAMESETRRGGTLRSELNILVGERFVVHLTGEGVDMDALKDAARDLDLRDLARER